MKDATGPYYYPVPANKQVKMYVRNNNDVIEFRLHNEQEPSVFERHGWVTLEAVRRAAEQYSGQVRPLELYDIEIAKRLLREETG